MMHFWRFICLTFWSAPMSQSEELNLLHPQSWRRRSEVGRSSSVRVTRHNQQISSLVKISLDSPAAWLTTESPRCLERKEGAKLKMLWSLCQSLVALLRCALTRTKYKWTVLVLRTCSCYIFVWFASEEIGTQAPGCKNMPCTCQRSDERQVCQRQLCQAPGSQK